MTEESCVSLDTAPAGELVPVATGVPPPRSGGPMTVQIVDRPAAIELPSRPTGTPPAVMPWEEGPLGRVLDSRTLVVMLILFAGPLGLVAMWASRRFPRWLKIAVSLAFVLLTVVAPIAVTWYYLNVAVAPLVESFSHR